MGIRSPWARAAAETLANLGHEVHAIDFQESKDSYLGGLEESGMMAKFQRSVAAVHLLRGFPVSSVRYFLAVPQFRRFLGAIRPDVLLVLYGGGFAQLAFLSGFRPYVVFAVGSEVLLRSGIQRQITRFAFERASHVFANGQFLATKTRELAPKAAVTSLLLGVDIDRFVSDFPLGSPHFLCNRGFRYPYNNDFIIRALSNLGQVGPFTFHFASAGPELQSSQALAASILPPNLKESVKFWGGLPEDQMLDLIRRSRFFVSMSFSDGTATSMLEAMACGAYPILSDIPQNREWIFPEHQNGALVPLQDARALTTILAHAINEPEIQLRTAEFNRNVVRQHADSKANLALLASKLATIASQHLANKS